MQNIKKYTKCFCVLVCGAFFVGFKGKMRPRRTKAEALAVIMNWGTLEDTKRIKQHRFHRGPVCGEWLFARILQFSMLAGDARPEA